MPIHVQGESPPEEAAALFEKELAQWSHRDAKLLEWHVFDSGIVAIVYTVYYPETDWNMARYALQEPGGGCVGGILTEQF